MTFDENVSVKFKKQNYELPVVVSPERYEELRLIIKNEHGFLISFEEAKIIGDSLIKTYRILAGNREILGVKRQAEKKESNFPTELKKSGENQ
jgi:hypothetical protein